LINQRQQETRRDMKRIKVSFGETKLVVPCGKDSDPVSRLIQDINIRLQSHLGDPSVRIKELTTGDGFFINPNDTISEVLSDGWTVCGSDYTTWMNQQMKLCTTKWHTIDRSDFADDTRSYIEIGKHKHNKLYLRFGFWGNRADKTTRLELFDISDLESFGKGGKPLIARETVKNSKGVDRFSEASFVVEKGVVKGIELAMKMSSDLRPQIERVKFIVDNGSLEPANVKSGDDDESNTAEVVQKAEKEKPKKQYSVPGAKREGKTLDQVMTVINKELVDDKKKDRDQKKDAVGQGTSVIELKQKETSQADQCWYNDNSKSFTQYMYSNITFLNKTEKKVIITNAKAEYLTATGEWKACDGISLGTRSGWWHYSWGRYDPKGFTVEASATVDIAVRAEMEVKEINHDKNRWIHHSLPNPLQIKFSIEDADGGKSFIVTQYENDPLVVETFESKKKKVAEEGESKKLLMFTYADDVPAEVRISAHLVSDSSQQRPSLIFGYQSGGTNGGKTFYIPDEMRRLVWEATKAGKEEYLVKDAGCENEKHKCSVTLTALIDLKEQWAYAFKVEIKSATSSTTEYFLIP